VEAAVIVERLEAFGTICDGACLALWRPQDGTTFFVAAGDIDRAGLEVLTADLLPVAFVTVRRENGKLQVAAHPVDSDFDDEPGLTSYMQAITAQFLDELAADGVVRRPTVQ